MLHVLILYTNKLISTLRITDYEDNLFNVFVIVKRTRES